MTTENEYFYEIMDLTLWNKPVDEEHLKKITELFMSVEKYTKQDADQMLRDYKERKKRRYRSIDDPGVYNGQDA